MRLPRKVTICGKKYKVFREPKKYTGYGRGNTATKRIVIGSKNRDSDSVFETFVHEITELVMLENSCRFNRDSNDEFFYMIKHPELERITTDIAIAIKPMIRR